MKRVPNRPVWLKVYEGFGANSVTWKDQQLVSVTRHTLQLAQSALQDTCGKDYYHNYGAALAEIIEVLDCDD